MAIRTYKVTLDSKNTIAPEPVYLRQGDKTGAVVIDATLMDNGSPVSLSGLTPMFKANTADGQAVIADSTGFTVTDSDNGKFTYQVPNALSAIPGKITTAYFSLSDADGSESTFDVAFIIKAAIDISQGQADDYITIIDGTLNSLQKKIDAMNTDIQTVLNAYNQGDFYNKSETDSKYAEITAQLANKADYTKVNILKSQVDTLVVESGSSDAEVAMSRGGWNLLDNRVSNLETPNELYDGLLIDDVKTNNLNDSDLNMNTGIDRLFVLPDFTTDLGIKSAFFKTAMVNAKYNDFTLYLFRKIEDNVFQIVYSNVFKVNDGLVSVGNIKTNEKLYMGWKGNVKYDDSDATDTDVYAFSTASDGDDGIITTTNNGTFRPACKIVTYSKVRENIQNKYKGETVSILADSISTYDGYIPEGNATYYPNEYITNVEQTWWKKLLNATGMELLVNNAWSGSRMVGTSTQSGNVRSTLLDDGTRQPDNIIIEMGVNDFKYPNELGTFNGSNAVPTTTATFREAYAVALKKIRTKYPNAKIFLCTIMQHQYNNVIGFPIKNGNGVQLKDFNIAIHELSDIFGAEVIEFDKCGINYYNLSTYCGDKRLHPNVSGMDLMFEEALTHFS